ncbi:MAG: type II toxin-antitoxin system VapC family toxin [Candidatus Heimdallarchaeota archaeon]
MGGNILTLYVVLDTNILLLASEGRFNVTREIERIVPQKHEIVYLSACLRELEHLAEKPKMSRKILFAKKFLESLQIAEFDLPDDITIDEKIVQYAIKNKSQCVIVTNDNELKKRLLEHSIAVIFIRSKSHLELVGTLPT